MFKFLKFVDEIKSIVEILRKKNEVNHILVKYLSLCARICGFFYYILDNLVWFANMGMISNFAFKNLKWKRAKDMFTLIKNWLEVFKSIIVWMESV